MFLTSTPRRREAPDAILTPRSEGEEAEGNPTSFDGPTRLPEEKKPQASVEKVQEEELLELLRNKAHQEIDADQLFFASLVPEFKKLKDDQKIDVKIELLQVIRSSCRRRSNHSMEDLCLSPKSVALGHSGYVLYIIQTVRPLSV